jgi:hypothetical protein
MSLSSDFGALATGAGVYGCGLEAQMESWYRFLVQPDPWDAIQLDTNQNPFAAQLVGVDTTILQQRHDFLRPDSVVAIVVVTDEEDAWSDPMWKSGRGWLARAEQRSRRPDSSARHTDLRDQPGRSALRWCAVQGTQNVELRDEPPRPQGRWPQRSLPTT